MRMKTLIWMLLAVLITPIAGFSQTVKNITGVETSERTVESAGEIQTADYTIEAVGSVSITSSDRVVLKPGTHFKTGAYFNGKSEAVSGEKDEIYGGEMFESPLSEPLNTLPQNIEYINPAAGIKKVLVPTPNNYGTLELSYPVEVPEGIGGLTPKMAVRYSSGAAGGNCGDGWNIAISSIHLDNKMGVPLYNGQSEQFMLDGRELVRVGADEYRLKREGAFLKAKYDAPNMRFIVYYPDGDIHYYGGHPAALLFNPNLPDQVYSWYLWKVVDKFGNQMVYEYEEAVLGGKPVNLYPSRIEYAFADPGRPLYRVEFQWGDRPDITSNYSAGFLVKNSKILEDIRLRYIGNNEKLLKRYHFTYLDGALGRKILQKITEYPDDGYGTLLNGMEFTYQDTSGNITFSAPVEWTFSGDTNETNETVAYQDVTGDGLPDIVRIKTGLHSTNPKVIIGVNTGTGFENGSDWISGRIDNLATPGMGSELSSGIKQLTDVNGDGITDIVGTLSGNGETIIWFGINNGSGFDIYDHTILNINQAVGLDNLKESVFRDSNGDGYKDIIYWTDNGSDYTYYLSTFKDGAYTNIESWNSDEVRSKESFVDMNNDGLLDVISAYNELYPGGSIKSTTIDVWMNKGRFFEPKIAIDSPNHRRLLLDLDGDSIPDLVDVNNSAEIFKVVYQKGIENGFVSYDTTWFSYVKPEGGSAEDSYKIIDINGDGYQDVIFEETPDKLTIWQGDISEGNKLVRIDNVKTDTYTILEYEDIYFDIDPAANKNYREIEVLSSCTTGSDILSFKKNIYYSRGILDYIRHRSRGFEYVTVSTYDSVQDVTFATETFYTAGSHSGSDQFGGILYDDYLTGETKSIKKMYVTGSDLHITNGRVGRSDVIIQGTRHNSFAVQPVYGSDTYYERPDVKITYVDEIREIVYDDSGTPLFDTQNNGPVVSTTNITFTSDGLINTITENTKGDPNHDNDDVSTVISFASQTSGGKWLAMAYKTSRYEASTGVKIGGSTIYFDNYTIEGDILEGKKTKIVDFNNLGDDTYRNVIYDTYGNIASLSDQSGLVTLISTNYDQAGVFKKSVVTPPAGAARSVEIDKYGMLFRSTDSYGDTITYSHDDYGRITKIVGPGDTDSSPLMSVTYSVENLMDRVYDAPMSWANEWKDYFTAKVQYKDTSDDGYLNAHYYIDMAGFPGQSKIEASVNGVKGWVISGRSYYDAMGRVIKEGPASSKGYDVDPDYHGDTQFYSSSYNTYYDYDRLGRISEIIVPGGQKKISYYYNTYLDEEYESFIDAQDHTKTWEAYRVVDKVRVVSYDITNTMPVIIADESVYRDLSDFVVRTDSWGESNTLLTNLVDFDLRGNRKEMDPSGKVVQTKHDSLGRLFSVTTPDAGLTTYEYDMFGRLSRIAESGRDLANPRNIEYKYDSLNRVEKIDYPGYKNDIDYTYYDYSAGIDTYARGRVKSVTKGAGEYMWGSTVITYNPYFEEHYTYDRLEKGVTKKIEGSSFTTGYTYDVQGRISELVTPDGETVSYRYNHGGMLEGITGSKTIGGSERNETYVHMIHYNVDGLKVYEKFGNGAETSYEYDPYTRLMDKFDVVKEDFTILSYDYQFDPSGKITSISGDMSGQSSFVQDYSYDLVNRLVGSTGSYTSAGTSGTYNRSFEYSTDSRIERKNLSDGRSKNNVYSPISHEVTGVYERNFTGTLLSLTAYSYDDYGNMAQKDYFIGDSTISSRMWKYWYDEANRMISYTHNSEKVDFQYDHRGKRIYKKVYDSNILTSESTYVNGFYTIKNGTHAVHITDGKNVVVSKSVSNPDRQMYHHQNHVGSTALVTDGNGGKIQSYLYYPYGEMWVVESGSTGFVYDDDQEVMGSLNVSSLFTGQIYDKETGFYYYNARYYDPNLGSFTRPDPALDGVNHYGYCKGNPVMYTDPSGLTTQGESGRNKAQATTASTAASTSSGDSSGSNGSSGSNSGGKGSQGLSRGGNSATGSGNTGGPSAGRRGAEGTKIVRYVMSEKEAYKLKEDKKAEGFGYFPFSSQYQVTYYSTNGGKKGGKGTKGRGATPGSKPTGSTPNSNMFLKPEDGTRKGDKPKPGATRYVAYIFAHLSIKKGPGGPDIDESYKYEDLGDYIYIPGFSNLGVEIFDVVKKNPVYFTEDSIIKISNNAFYQFVDDVGNFYTVFASQEYDGRSLTLGEVVQNYHNCTNMGENGTQNSFF